MRVHCVPGTGPVRGHHVPGAVPGTPAGSRGRSAVQFGHQPSSLDTGSAGAPLAHWPGRGPSRLPAVGFVVVAAHYEAAPLRRELATPRAALVSRLPATGRLDPPLWAAASRAQPDQAKAKPANRTRGGRLRSARSLAELLAARAGPAMPRSR